MTFRGIVAGLAIVAAQPALAADPVPSAASAQIDAAMAALSAKNPTEARRLMEAAAATGDPLAMGNFAVFVFQGIGGPPDRARGRELLERSVAAGSVTGKLNLGAMLVGEPDAAAQKRGVSLLKEVMSDPHGSGPASYYLGRALVFGIGAPADIPEGVRLLQASLEANPRNADAQFLVGRAYQAGWGGTPRDPQKAFVHFQRAAEGGDIRAWRNLGLARLYGEGAPKDLPAAYADFRRGAEAGDPLAMVHVAVMLATAQGVPGDPPQARQWYLKAAQKGSAHALRGYGAMLARGEGGPVELAKGLAYLELAHAAGDSNAGMVLPHLTPASLPPEERARIDAAKAEWIRLHGAPRNE